MNFTMNKDNIKDPLTVVEAVTWSELQITRSNNVYKNLTDCKDNVLNYSNVSIFKQMALPW